MIYKISKEDKMISGSIDLPASKSISNRLLIIRALCNEPFEISNISEARDTMTLNIMLNDQIMLKNVGDAGTAFRFLTAYLAIQEGTWVLTGSPRMKERPIGPLVEALQELGAEISYMEQEGFPPLEITGKTLSGGKVALRSDQSSQFVSALMMIAPTMKEGLSIELGDTVASKPYIKMTMSLMRQYGVPVRLERNIIHVPHLPYEPRAYHVESDWSAASYYYALAALSANADLQLKGLRWDSLQGDKAVVQLMESFGLKTTFNQEGASITSTSKSTELFEYNFIDHPDLAQTIMALCTAKKITGRFSGVESLRIKETDRLLAMKNELAKVGGHLFEKGGVWNLMPIEKFKRYGPTIFHAYNDHRMVMSLACFSMIFNEVFIEDPDAIHKSNPYFWDHLSSLDFTIEQVSAE